MRCGYIRQTWDCGDTMEVEEKHTGRHGARGQKRKKRKEPTPEDIERQNQWKRVRDIRRLIKWNFSEGDCWATLTCRKGDRPAWEQLKKEVAKFIRKLREQYKKHGWELKYIYRMQIGKNGAPHVHILLNGESDNETRTEKLIKELWKLGHANSKVVYEVNDGELAKYIATPLEEQEPEDAKKYHPSRNLIRKDPDEKEVNRRSLVDKQGNIRYPKPPKGFYVDKNSFEKGINPITGYAYRHYTLVKINRRI